MKPRRHVLIVKHGALGDVVRTSYFARALHDRWRNEVRVSWLTAPASAPLLRFNPNVDDVWTAFDQAKMFRYDRVYSLDDEREVLEGVSRLNADAITGAILRDGAATYTEDSAEWFDMGLLSRFGKSRADELKKRNRRGHAEIFCGLFDVDCTTPHFFGNPRLEAEAVASVVGDGPIVGINPFAGGRWPSKELRQEELDALIGALLAGTTSFGPECRVLLIGAGPDRARNLQLAASHATKRILVPDTDDSILRLAALIRCCSALVTSDSLAMHLAIAQGVRAVAFFAPTSAPEIDGFGLLAKVVSTASDYCSYRKDADNSSITAERILQALMVMKRGDEARPVAAGGTRL